MRAALAALLLSTSALAAPPADLTLHASVSALLAGDLYALGAARDVPRARAALVAGGVTLGVGAAKELLLDRVWGGDPSWGDFAADALGTLAGLTLSWLVDVAVMR